MDLAEKRFSARKFTSEQVSESDMRYILEAARLAPSACNRQPWRFFVAQSDEAKTRLRRCYQREWFATAPAYIVCASLKNECWVRGGDGKPHGDIDVAIAAEHICLAAADRGLGTCWVCNFDVGEMRNFLSDDSLEAVAIIPVGHISQDCPRALRQRKDLSEIVEYL